ncbi:hypothetical protein DAT35_14195 [Vitiosangium sp. GDMCC 1.1324]|nr:hypothetical protein DAT35_14195 [Vitiosangium sp. GDMCC 1.1324]
MTAFAAGLGLLLWATVPSSSNSISEAAPGEASPPTGRPTALRASPGEPPPMLDAKAVGSRPLSTVAASRDTRPGPPAQPPPHSETVLASFAPGSSADAPLPLPSAEISSDGLPAAAMHCQWTGGVLKCGSCRTSGDCAPNQGCLVNRETRRLECMASECEEDAHCFPGFTCRTLLTGTSNTTIRRCVPVGERREGESCDPDYISRIGACREGLRCINQVCTVPCRLEDSASCPSGHTCMDDGDGPGCVPDCEKLGCPQGQRCKRLPRGGNRCLARVSGTCPETPCAEDERCMMDGSRSRGTFWCARVCNPIQPGGCPTGHVCGWAGGTSSVCFRQCDPRDLDSCGPGWMCATVSEDLSLWGCSPSALEP